MKREPVVRVGVGVLVWKDHRLLMIRRVGEHGGGTWSCPGGHLEFGESLEACARRECLEEVGIDIGQAGFRTVTNDVFPETGKHYLTVWMEAEISDEEAVVNSPRELDEVRWCEPMALPEPLFIPMIHFLEKNALQGGMYRENL